jgi:hypothetical protein
MVCMLAYQFPLDAMSSHNVCGVLDDVLVACEFQCIHVYF